MEPQTQAWAHNLSQKLAVPKTRLPLTPPLTPPSIRSTASDTPHSLEALTLTPAALNITIPNWSSSPFAVFPSPTSPVQDTNAAQATRILFVSGVPPLEPTHRLKQAFVQCGDLKEIIVKFQRKHGIIILVFHDMRHTQRAYRVINSGRSFFPAFYNEGSSCGHGGGSGRLEARFIGAEKFRGSIDLSFITTTDGSLLITTSSLGASAPHPSAPHPKDEAKGELKQSLEASALQNVLSGFGELRMFKYEPGSENGTYHAEFFDSRDAQSALTALNGRIILRKRLHISPASMISGSFPHFDFSVTHAEDEEPTSETEERNGGEGPGEEEKTNTIPFPTSTSPVRVVRKLSLDSSIPFPVSLADGNQGPLFPFSSGVTAAAAATSTSAHPHHGIRQDVHTRRNSNIYHFDSTLLANRHTAHLRTPPRPRSISVELREEGGLGEVEVAMGEEGAGTGAEYAAYEVRQHAQTQDEPPQHAAFATQIQTAFAALSSIEKPSMCRNHADLDAPQHDGNVPPERNTFDVHRIERGDDTRTTVMIKNIPNKMSTEHLFEFVSEVCPRKIDFLYLRIDFANGYNVGYAFVNFIQVEDLLHFARVKLGTKWNLFSSKKVLGMSYANEQGKEALIDRFRSSSVMDQCESWRPKLFHSFGPHKGTPEDFPAPTYLRRKDRRIEGAGGGSHEGVARLKVREGQGGKGRSGKGVTV